MKTDNSGSNGFSLRRLRALCKKEYLQIVRDPSSILIAFILPVILLFMMGYAINLDTGKTRIGVLSKDTGALAKNFVSALANSPYIDMIPISSQAELLPEMAHKRLKGAVVIQNDFSAKSLNGNSSPAIQVITDGGETNTATFVAAYIQGIWQNWREAQGEEKAIRQAAPIEIHTRSWFNPSTISRNFLVPGTIGIVLTIIGAMLTSLVVAREWERGTMEALLASPITKLELLLSKIIPYYVLSMLAMFLCLVVATTIMGVPFRGSIIVLCLISTLFMGCSLGLGLFLSTVMRNQFDAATATLLAAFLPSMLLGGVVFEILSMPLPIRIITQFIPARYYANSLQTIFQAGLVPSLLWKNSIFLFALMILWLALTAKKTKRTLE
ncbi:MAG: ABC transporter permease [Holophagales bacterium]|jgi:ABC-2 type transport system permease protein|nr:ABC transporter permease [Holophagales bacterium]